MTLVDSSVWINHLRKAEPRLTDLLDNDQVVVHPCVIGELALGSLKDRSRILHDIQLLPLVSLASDGEILEWIERRRVFGKGIGWVDAHLLLACVLNNVELWTVDRTLASVARSCGAKLSVFS